jgi:hypothetical protein
LARSAAMMVNAPGAAWPAATGSWPRVRRQCVRVMVVFAHVSSEKTSAYDLGRLW